ncbi:MAG: hypothetical protein AAF847_11990 [Bacteroidota bacterium]
MRIILFSILCCSLVACANQQQNKEEELLQQAGQIHLEAIKIDETVKPKFAKMTRAKEQLAQKQAELTPEENQLLQKMVALEQSYTFWNENHVEVPGFEHEGHDHHDHSHHDHDHGPSLDVSAEDMLVIQQEFKDSLVSIAERLESLAIPDSLLVQ